MDSVFSLIEEIWSLLIGISYIENIVCEAGFPYKEYTCELLGIPISVDRSAVQMCMPSIREKCRATNYMIAIW